MAQTQIEWTWTRCPQGRLLPGFTFNPWEGCERVSEGCALCYAEDRDRRYQGGRHWGPKCRTLRKMMTAPYWRQPFAWNRMAQREGTPLRVFCASLADVFEDHSGPCIVHPTSPVQTVPEARARLWQVIGDTPWLVWMLLTKRPANIRRLAPLTWRTAWPERVWIGTSVESPLWAQVRIPSLLKIPAPVRFLSVEPLLGPIACLPLEGVSWVICGGESGGRKERQVTPLHPDWARSIRDQCAAAGVPFFFKQWGGRTAKAGGRLLDGRTWDEVPASAAVPDSACVPASRDSSLAARPWWTGVHPC